MADPVDGYFSRDGRLHTWPSRKRSDLRVAILRRIWERFEFDRVYSELQVNDLLRSWMIFDDHVLVRRELCDGGFLARESDGTRYWKVERSAETQR